MNTSFQVHYRDPFYLQAVSEHRDLHEAVDRVKALFDACAHGAPRESLLAELTRQLQRLREQMAQHFEQEQLGGYLEEAMIRLPRISPQIQALQRQHPDLLAAATRSLQQLDRPSHTVGDWACMAEEFGQFAKRLSAHEVAEDVLLQKAFNEDPGLEIG